MTCHNTLLILKLKKNNIQYLCTLAYIEKTMLAQTESGNNESTN